MAGRFRVVHSTDAWLPLTEAWLHYQISNLPQKVDNHIACIHTTNLERFAISYIHEMQARWSMLPSSLARRTGFENWLFRRHLRQVVREKEADILHSHFGNRAWADMAVVSGTDVRHVATFYGYDVSRLPASSPRWKERYATLFESVSLVLCEGPYMAKSIEKLGCPPAKVRVHHLGVPVDQITYRPRRWRQNEPLRVLMAAAFREKKGIPIALEALAIVARDQPLEITIIGDADDSALRQAEKARILGVIDRQHMSSQVRLLGYVSHEAMIEEAYGNHIFLSPSVTARDGDAEGGAPVTLIEMAATGLPIISTKHCDIPEVVIDGATGALAEERDIDGLVEHIRAYLANPARYATMAEAGRHRMETEYDAKIQGRRLLQQYARVLEG